MLFGLAQRFAFTVKKYVGPNKDATVRCYSERFLYKTEMIK